MFWPEVLCMLVLFLAGWAWYPCCGGAVPCENCTTCVGDCAPEYIVLTLPAISDRDCDCSAISEWSGQVPFTYHDPAYGGDTAWCQFQKLIVEDNPECGEITWNISVSITIRYGGLSPVYQSIAVIISVPDSSYIRWSFSNPTADKFDCSDATYIVPFKDTSYWVSCQSTSESASVYFPAT